jgi:hypothetical protein
MDTATCSNKWRRAGGGRSAAASRPYLVMELEARLL